MKLVKDALDVGIALATPDAAALAPVLAFWRERAGVDEDHLLPLGGGRRQHRHGWGASVIKLNAHRDGTAAGAATGWGPLTLRGPGLAATTLEDPEGQEIRLEDAATRSLEIGLRVPDAAASLAFFAGLGLATETGRVAVGSCTIAVTEDPAAPADADMTGTGLRYVTMQVDRVDAAHEEALAAGGLEGMAPKTLGDVARISFVREPGGGNWIELSQRRSLVGDLEAR